MSHRSNRFAFSIFLVAAAVLMLGACSSSSKKKERFAYVEKPVETLYLDASTALEKKKYKDAIALFGEVERQHPYSPWARRAVLMKAFSQYGQDDYDDAIGTLDGFIALHPGNKDAPYAYYLKAMCYYERIRDVGRDQDYTVNAVQALTDVVRRYPETEYARDAQLKLDLTLDHLAGKEMYVGRYYLKQGNQIAAINRFKNVVDNFQTTSQVPEALYRLVESYLQIGVASEARESAAVLGYNYPGSTWYQQAYNMLRKNGLLEAGSSPKRSAKEIRKLKKRERETSGKKVTNGVGTAIAPPVDDPADEPFEDAADPVLDDAPTP